MVGNEFFGESGGKNEFQAGLGLDDHVGLRVVDANRLALMLMVLSDPAALLEVAIDLLHRLVGRHLSATHVGDDAEGKRTSLIFLKRQP